MACETCRRRKVRCDCRGGFPDVFLDDVDPTQLDESALSQENYSTAIDDAASQHFIEGDTNATGEIHALDSALDFFNTALPDDSNFGIFDSTLDLFQTPPFVSALRDFRSS